MARKMRKFKTEVQKLLDLVINSLYSKKEIFLRELISNSSDAIDRLRFEALTSPELTGGDSVFKIKIIPDRENKTLTISDNGVGMTDEELEKNISTIASSGTRNFIQKIQSGSDEQQAEFIGQFGVGFYSAFMVADRVTILTRRAGQDQAWRWSSNGTGDYEMEEAEKLSRGTEITLYLRDDCLEYLEEWILRRIVKSYSDYIAFPIVMDVATPKKTEKEGEEDIETIEEETLNSMKAIWKKARHEVNDDEYNEFYKHISRDFIDPLEVIHYHGEGTTEFRALLYLPAQAPFDLMTRDSRRGVHLYVKNVFITDDCEALLPDYLRFVSGVVDSSDLPLNVSREMLQDDVVIRRIRKNIVGKILGTLTDIKEKEPEKFLKFYREFGKVIKEAIATDYENKDKVLDLLMYPSTKTDEKDSLVSLAGYVERMPELQQDIYYITGEDIDVVANSPHLEIFRKKGFEVLFFTDLVDEWVLPNMGEYKGKKFKPIHRGEVDLDTEEEKKQNAEELEARDKEYKGLLQFIQKKLDNDIADVKLSRRLTDSAVCLVADDNGMNIQMERIMKAMNKDVPSTKRIMELNPGHPLMNRLKHMFDENREDQRLADYIELLHEQALVSEGSSPKNPRRFAQLVSELMVSAN